MSASSEVKKPPVKTGGFLYIFGTVLVLVVRLGSVPVMVHVLNVVVVLEGVKENRTLINGSIKPIQQHAINAFVP